MKTVIGGVEDESASTITLIETGIPDIRPMLGRSPGIHVSNIIHELAVRYRHYDPEDLLADPASGMVRMKLGAAWEYALIEMWKAEDPEEYTQPGEAELDGIPGTADLIVGGWSIANPRRRKIREVKITWMSSAHEPNGPKFWRFWAQGKAYCRIHGLTRCQLDVTHVNGNCRDKRSPVRHLWEREFTRAELLQNWIMLRRNRDRMLERAQARREGAQAREEG